MRLISLLTYFIVLLERKMREGKEGKEGERNSTKNTLAVVKYVYS